MADEMWFLLVINASIFSFHLGRWVDFKSYIKKMDDMQHFYDDMLKSYKNIVAHLAENIPKSDEGCGIRHLDSSTDCSSKKE